MGPKIKVSINSRQAKKHSQNNKVSNSPLFHILYVSLGHIRDTNGTAMQEIHFRKSQFIVTNIWCFKILIVNRK